MGHLIVNLMESQFPNEGEAIVEQILASEEINKSKQAGLWESQSWGSK